MARTANVFARVEPEVKEQAEQVLDNIAAIKNTEFSDEELKKIDKIVKDNE